MAIIQFILTLYIEQLAKLENIVKAVIFKPQLFLYTVNQFSVCSDDLNEQCHNLLMPQVCLIPHGCLIAHDCVIARVCLIAHICIISHVCLIAHVCLITRVCLIDHDCVIAIFYVPSLEMFQIRIPLYSKSRLTFF